MKLSQAIVNEAKRTEWPAEPVKRGIAIDAFLRNADGGLRAGVGYSERSARHAVAALDSVLRADYGVDVPCVSPFANMTLASGGRCIRSDYLGKEARERRQWDAGSRRAMLLGDASRLKIIAAISSDQDLIKREFPTRDGGKVFVQPYARLIAIRYYPKGSTDFELADNRGSVTELFYRASGKFVEGSREIYVDQDHIRSRIALESLGRVQGDRVLRRILTNKEITAEKRARQRSAPRIEGLDEIFV